ncbi:MAG: hypothetical protein NZ761_00590 [Dehalococcoidia bacterium]|nr:hypothetical protein [Dehalococcoidia bacterium]
MPKIVCSRGVEVIPDVLPGELEIIAERHSDWGGGWAARLEGRDPTAAGGVRRSFLNPRERHLSRSGSGMVTFNIELCEGLVLEVEYVRRSFECARAYFLVENGTVRHVSREEALARLPELRPAQILPLRVRIEVQLHSKKEDPLRAPSSISVKFLGRAAVPPEGWRNRLKEAGFRYESSSWRNKMPLEEALLEAAAFAVEILGGEPRPESVELAVEDTATDRYEEWYEIRDPDHVPTPAEMFRALGFEPEPEPPAAAAEPPAAEPPAAEPSGSGTSCPTTPPRVLVTSSALRAPSTSGS